MNTQRGKQPKVSRVSPYHLALRQGEDHYGYRNRGISNSRRRLMVKKLAYALLILMSIQLLNRFLIFSGSLLERSLPVGFQHSTAIVGAFQQVVQAVTGIVLYLWIFKKGLKDLGINTCNKTLSIKLFCVYALIWTSTIVLYVSLSYVFFADTWAAMKSIELPQTSTMISTLLFESFFPGLGEEILFRGLIINLLSAFVFIRFKDNKASKLGIIVLSSAYFAIAHIYFTLVPLRITHIDYLQIITALGCGAFYATFYLRTNSLLAPFLAHNFSNTTATIFGYIISGI